MSWRVFVLLGEVVEELVGALVGVFVSVMVGILVDMLVGVLMCECVLLAGMVGGGGISTWMVDVLVVLIVGVFVGV